MWQSYLECLEVAGVDSGLWIAVSCDIVDVPSPDTVDASESKLADDPAPLTNPVAQVFCVIDLFVLNLMTIRRLKNCVLVRIVVW